MKKQGNSNVIIGITAIIAMVGVAWTFYHYNMQNHYAEVRCDGIEQKQGKDSEVYKECIEHEKSMFTVKKSQEGRRKNDQVVNGIKKEADDVTK